MFVFLLEYRVFAKKVLVNLIDKNTNQNILIYIVLPHLNQQVVDLYVRLAGILKTGF